MKKNKRKTRTTAFLRSVRERRMERKRREWHPAASPRGLARSVARARMRAAGVQKVNRRMALNWRAALEHGKR